MKLCNDVMTLFNARVDPASGDMAYCATVIRGVGWHVSRGTSPDARGGSAVRRRAVVRVPLEADADGKRYVSPEAYRQAADVSGLYTLACGDLICRGEAEAPTGACLALCDITDNRSAPRGAHWKLVGGSNSV